MKRLFLACFLLFPKLIFAQNQAVQTDFNLDFEKKVTGQKLPEKWMQWGSGYQLSIDSLEKYSGKSSLRIKEPADRKENQFGCTANTIPAIYEGKEIELKGFMKFENVENGWAGLMLRVDGGSGTLQFSNMKAENLHGTEGWKQYSIKLPYPKSASIIHIGAILPATGQLWVDHFELFIDGKPISEAPIKKPVVAQIDKEFDGGSTVIIKEMNADLGKDLATLGRLWGFLKYYHPAVAKGDYNWDYQLFRVLKPFTTAKTSAERQKILSGWVAKLGTFEVSKMPPSTEPAMSKPGLGWLTTSGFDKNLVARLDSIKRAARTDESYYIGLFPGVGNPDFKNENPYPNMSATDVGFRLLCLFRYWNMIEYYFPYKPLIKEDWHAVLTEFVPKFVKASDDTAYKLATLELITRVKDTHANVYNPDPSLAKHFGTRYAPAQLTFVEGKPVVTDYYNAALGEKSGLKTGDVIETVNGKNIDQIIKESLVYIPASNYPTQLKNLTSNLLRTNDSTLAVGFKRKGKPMKANVSTFGLDQINLYANYNKKDTCFKMIQPDVAYIFPGKFKNAYLDKLLPEISKTKGLVIDMRCYPSDFMVFTFGSFLLPEARPFVKFSKGSLETPGIFTMTPELKVGGSNPDYYKGKVVIIVNESTLSQSEYTTMAFSAALNVKILGSTTAAADGNVSLIALPGGIRTGISGIGVYYPNGKETQQVGIVPDIEVKPTIQGIADGRDELLEKALLEINGK
jgi:C-terminal processing protease CtpA/Prc